jgi:NADH-ubiquinone oxidoreductase chain 3
MLIVIYLLITSCLLIIILKLVSTLIAESTLLNREELSPYECGFEHHNVSRIPFSLRYFFLTLIFLLFDLEVVLMLFIPYYLLSSFYTTSLCFLIAFIFVLYISLIYE